MIPRQPAKMVDMVTGLGLDMDTPILYNLTGWDLTVMGLLIGFIIYIIRWNR
jgi:hypothetical protein